MGGGKEREKRKGEEREKVRGKEKKREIIACILFDSIGFFSLSRISLILPIT